MKNERTITRCQLRCCEAGWEGRLWETCEPMNKNRIEGRRGLVSWHHTAKPFGSSAEVNAAVVQGSIESLPREVSKDGVGRLKGAAKTAAPVVVMPQASSSEKSAEGIVVVEPESVSSRRRATRPAKNAAQQTR